MRRPALFLAALLVGMLIAVGLAVVDGVHIDDTTVVARGHNDASTTTVDPCQPERYVDAAGMSQHCERPTTTTSTTAVVPETTTTVLPAPAPAVVPSPVERRGVPSVEPPTGGEQWTTTSTAYCYGTTTASGAPVRDGVVGVSFADFARLSGSSWLILDGPLAGKVVTVEDKGSRAHFDIYLASCADADEYGRRTITVERVG